MSWTASRPEVAAMVACRCARCVSEHGIKSEDMSGFPWSSTHMLLCPECGNKRCPKAQDHRFACTGSNEPGQVGVSIEAQRDEAVKSRDYERAAWDECDKRRMKFRRERGEAVTHLRAMVQAFNPYGEPKDAVDAWEEATRFLGALAGLDEGSE